MDSSGSDTFRISNGRANDPPISFGFGWWDKPTDGPSVRGVNGLESVKRAYSQIPGLGGCRDYLHTITLFGFESVRDDTIVLQKARGPVWLHGFGMMEVEEITVDVWMAVMHKTGDGRCIEEIVEYSDVDNTDRLYCEVWKELANAADEWPIYNWGNNPSPVTEVEVRLTSDKAKMNMLLSESDADRVLSYARLWASRGSSSQPVPSRPQRGSRARSR